MIDHFALWCDVPICVVDFETTGTAPTRGDRIVEIAVVRVEKLKIVKKWQTFINPQRPIPEEASRVHGIYDEDVALAPTFKQKAAEFIAFCDGAVPCAYQEGFDRGFAMAEFWSANISLDMPMMKWTPWLDVLAWVRSVDRFVGPDDAKVSNKLTEACKRRGIDTMGAHGALADVTQTALLLAAISPEMHRSTISELLRRQQLLSAAYDRRWQKSRT